MTLSAGTVSIGVTPDTTGLGKKLSSGIMAESGGLGEIGKNLGGLLLAGLGAVGITAGIGEFVKKGFEEYSAADAINAQFAAGIKSTNNAANLSVKGMDDLAASIAGYSGQAYDSIGKTEQVLQTFTNIKNVGPDKIFDDATTAAANMAAKLGGDASSSAIQLGKALNDPVKGVTALRRVGVAFTDSQTASIAAMVASGNTMGAQKVILAELSREFGGAAEAAGQTLPGAIARSKVAFGELSKAAVSGLVPIIEPVISGVATLMMKVTPEIEGFSSFVTNAFDYIRGYVSGTGSTVDVGKWEGPLEAISTIVIGIQAVFKSVFGAIGPIVSSAWSEFKPVLSSLGSAFAGLWPTIQKLVPQAIALFSAFSPVHLILSALAPVLPTLVDAVGKLAVSIGGALVKTLSMLMPTISKVAALLSGELASIVQELVPIVLKLVAVIGPVLGQVLTEAAPLIGVVAKYIGQLLQAVLPLIQPVLQLMMAFVPLTLPLIQLVGVILKPLIQLLQLILTPVMALVLGLVKFLVPAISAVVSAITWLVTNVLGAKIEFAALGSVAATIGKTIGKVFSAIGSVVKGGFDGVVSFVKGIFNTIIGLVNGVIKGINSATSIGASIGIKVGKIPAIPKLAAGGTILPTPGGTIVRVAEAGKAETVVDTASLNAAVNGNAKAKPSQIVNNIYEAVSARATALQVNRLQAAVRA